MSRLATNATDRAPLLTGVAAAAATAATANVFGSDADATALRTRRDSSGVFGRERRDAGATYCCVHIMHCSTVYLLIRQVATASRHRPGFGCRLIRNRHSLNPEVSAHIEFSCLACTARQHTTPIKCNRRTSLTTHNTALPRRLTLHDASCISLMVPWLLAASRVLVPGFQHRELMN